MPIESTQLAQSFTAEAYYHEAMCSLSKQDVTSALNYIDMAISLSSDKALYLSYKIKILYLTQLTSECTTLITQHLKFLYSNVCLQTFAQILQYLQDINEYTSDQLSDILTLHHIPNILAYEYHNLINYINYDFYTKALESNKNSNFKACIDYCHLSIRLSPNSIPLLHLQASACTAIQDYVHTIDLYEQMLLLDPSTSEVAYPLALAYIQTGEFSKAIPYLKQSLHKSALEELSLLNLGECYSKLKEYKNAIFYYKKFIAINTTDSHTYLKLGELHKLTRHPYQAKKYYKLATKLQKTVSITTTHSLNSTINHSLKYIKWLIGTTILIFVMYSQFYLFHNGIIPSLVYAVDTSVSNSTIPINGFTDFEIHYKQFPSYAKKPEWNIISNNPNIADIIPGVNSLNGFSLGKATFNINLNNKPKAQFHINVREALPIEIKLNISNTLLEINSTSNLVYTIIYEDGLSYNQIPTFTSSNPEVISISSDGSIITALTLGESTITASCGDIHTSIKLKVVEKLD